MVIIMLMESMTLDVEPSEIPEKQYAGNLTDKQAKFIASYQLTHNSTESAINPGYSVKTAAQAGCRMLKNPKVINELKQWQVKKSKEFRKEDFIDLALKDYGAVDVKEANRPRFLELAAKGAGHLKNENANVQIIIGTDALASMRASLTNRGKLINIPSGMPIDNPSNKFVESSNAIIPPPIDNNGKPIMIDSVDTASSSDINTPEKKLEAQGEGGVGTPQAP